MRFATAGTIVLLFGAVPASAQTAPAMTVHPVVYGVELTLPADWVRDSVAGLQELLARTDEWMRAPSLERIQQTAAAFSATPVFRGFGPQGRTDVVVLLLIPTPGMTARNFDIAPPGGVADLTAVMCATIEAQVRAASGTGGCTGHELRSVAGRMSLIIRQRFTVESSGIDNDRVLAQIPMENAMLTLIMSTRRNAESERLLAAVVASVRIP